MGEQQNGYILVVGAAHPDIFADYKRSQTDKIDKPGELTYSIGGTAYNIAVNLGQNHLDVALYTFIKSDSLFTDLIIDRLENSGVNTDFVQPDDYMSESGFIALRKEGKLVSAVTCSGITEVAFDRSNLKSAVKDAAFVVVDCNLDERQLEVVVSIADEFDKRILVSAVSESKAKRIVEISEDIDLFSLNNDEACSLLECDDLDRSDLSKTCADLGIKQLTVTKGRDGYLVANKQNVSHYSAPPINEVVSTSGTGDAFMASICHYLYENDNIDLEDAREYISTYVSDVIEQEGSTVGAKAKDRELSVRDRVNDQIERIAGYPWWEKAAIVAGLLSAVITIASFLSGAFGINDIQLLLEHIIETIRSLAFLFNTINYYLLAPHVLENI